MAAPVRADAGVVVLDAPEVSVLDVGLPTEVVVFPTAGGSVRVLDVPGPAVAVLDEPISVELLDLIWELEPLFPAPDLFPATDLFPR